MEIKQLYRGSDNILKLKFTEGQIEKNCPIRPILYFPLTRRLSYIGLFELLPDQSIGDELVLILDLTKVDLATKELIEQELKKTVRPIEITRVYSIKQSGNKFKIEVQTEEGRISFETEQRNISSLQSIMVIKSLNKRKYYINLTTIASRDRNIINSFI